MSHTHLSRPKFLCPPSPSVAETIWKTLVYLPYYKEGRIWVAGQAGVRAPKMRTIFPHIVKTPKEIP